MLSLLCPTDIRFQCMCTTSLVPRLFFWCVQGGGGGGGAHASEKESLGMRLVYNTRGVRWLTVCSTTIGMREERAGVERKEEQWRVRLHLATAGTTLAILERWINMREKVEAVRLGLYPHPLLNLNMVL